jgi:hypothetical protein
MGVGGLALGIAFRAGRARGVARYHDIEEFPIYVRNLGFGLIPAGMGLIFLSIAVFLFETGSDDSAVAFALVSLVADAYSLVLVVIAPDFAKPKWLRGRRTLSHQ